MKTTIVLLSFFLVTAVGCKKKEGCTDLTAINYDPDAKKNCCCEYAPVVIPTTNLVIDSVSPTSGQTGSWVKIYGRNFESPTSNNLITFKGASPIAPSGWSLNFNSGYISAQVPSNAITGNITVTANSVPVAGPVFTVIP